MSNRIKKNLKMIFIYSDTLMLEMFQSLFLIFCNSIQLMFLECFYNSPIFRLLGIFSIFIGIFFMISVIRNCLSARLKFAKCYWAFCLSIIFLIIFTPTQIDIPIICSYAMQSIASLYIVWRLSVEYSARGLK